MKSSDTDLIVAIENNHAVVEALGFLIVTAMEASDSELAPIGMGVNVVFRWLADDARRNMDMAINLMREHRQLVALRDGEAGEKTVIATFAGDTEADRIVQRRNARDSANWDQFHEDRLAAAVDQLSDRAEPDATDDRRQAVIERLEGVDAAKLAEWANVDQEAVERVLGQLLAAETSRDEPVFTKQTAPKRARR